MIPGSKPLNFPLELGDDGEDLSELTQPGEQANDCFSILQTQPKLLRQGLFAGCYCSLLS